MAPFLHVERDGTNREHDESFHSSRHQSRDEAFTTIDNGSSFQHVGVQRVFDEEGTWVKELDKYH